MASTSTSVTAVSQSDCSVALSSAEAPVSSFQAGNIGLMETYYYLKTTDIRNVVSWCMGLGLISRGYQCPACGNPMKLVRREDCSDGYNWVCRVFGKGKAHHIKRSIRLGSWFEKSRLPIPTLLLITFMWCANLSLNFIREQLNVSYATATEWSNLCREVLQAIFTNNRIGGPGIIVEIDDSKLGTRKNKHGKLIREKWAFGGVERGSGRCFFSLVENCNKDILLTIVENKIASGTTLVSDCWREYDCLSDKGFVYLTENHNIIFKDPEAGALTNAIKGKWNSLERFLADAHIADDELGSYLAEYTWRKNYISTEARMQAFFDATKIVCPPQSQDPPLP